MDKQIRISAKRVATDTIKRNLGKFILISLIVILPQLLASSAIYILQPSFITPDMVNTLTQDEAIMIMKDLLSFQVYSQIGIIFITILFYPLTVGSIRVFMKLAKSEDCVISDIFIYYSSFKSFISCFTLLITKFFRIFTLFLPYLLAIIVLIVGVVLLNTPILIIPYFFAVIAITLFASGKAMIADFYEKISILNFEDEDFSRKYAYKDIKRLFKGKTKSLVGFILTYIPLSLLSLILAPMTFGIALAIYNSFYNLSVAIFISTYYTQQKSTHENLL